MTTVDKNKYEDWRLCEEAHQMKQTRKEMLHYPHDPPMWNVDIGQQNNLGIIDDRQVIIQLHTMLPIWRCHRAFGTLMGGVLEPWIKPDANQFQGNEHNDALMINSD